MPGHRVDWIAILLIDDDEDLCPRPREGADVHLNAALLARLRIPGRPELGLGRVRIAVHQ